MCVLQFSVSGKVPRIVLVRAGLQPNLALGLEKEAAVSIGAMLFEALRGSAYLMPWSRKKQRFSDN